MKMGIESAQRELAYWLERQRAADTPVEIKHTAMNVAFYSMLVLGVSIDEAQRAQSEYREAFRLDPHKDSTND